MCRPRFTSLENILFFSCAQSHIEPVETSPTNMIHVFKCSYILTQDETSMICRTSVFTQTKLKWFTLSQTCTWLVLSLLLNTQTTRCWYVHPHWQLQTQLMEAVCVFSAFCCCCSVFAQGVNIYQVRQLTLRVTNHTQQGLNKWCLQLTDGVRYLRYNSSLIKKQVADFKIWI